ncbi:proteasome activator complex subunit 3 isoform X2 [Neocloeon triangulifer]|uniref:proteasome activator complex subunit 3 isoform X2 n=1 Tax=Neocloeon triangulifer TaxID=2078957 RepID=UPI00286EC18B|nr:proteasome activator complex subunit 3 isoform X2 [Neocloeon triangulifer]
MADSDAKKAEELVLKEFPRKIVVLDELLKTSDFNRKNLEEVHESLNIPVPEPVQLNSHSEPVNKRWKADSKLEEITGTKVMALTNGAVPCNKHLCNLVFQVKPHVRQLVEDSNVLKMWVSFLIPKIEDGNNFGVSIQEDTLAEIQSVESEAAAFYDQISRYFLTRGKIVSKVAKYPHIEDYRRAVEELDEKEYLSLMLVLCEVRNRYSTLHDIVTKNLEKIKRPRSSNTESLY